MCVFWRFEMQVLRKGVRTLLLALLTPCIAGNAADIIAEVTARPVLESPILVNVSANIARLIAEEDIDGDRRITVKESSA